jgi:hypothetical protein
VRSDGAKSLPDVKPVLKPEAKVEDGRSYAAFNPNRVKFGGERAGRSVLYHAQTIRADFPIPACGVGEERLE